MRILICGGGIGGLTLAHGLRGYGDVTVLDRDPEASATGGYRLHLDSHACHVLARVLPPSTWAAIRAVSDDAGTFRAFSVADDHLRPLVVAREPEGEDRLLCNRPALRALLAEDLGDRVRFGARVERVIPAEREPRAVLSDGEVITADVIIGAEGSLSPTVTALVGAPTARPTGLIGVAGTTALEGHEEVPPFLLDGPGLAISGDGTGLFLSLTGLPQAGGNVPVEVRHLVPVPSLIWGLIARRDAIPDDIPGGAALTDLAAARLAGWEPRIRHLVTRASQETVASYTFRASPARGDLTPWRSGLVTAIGDAVHCMPPTGGRAAATAIRDAGYLTDALCHRPKTPEGARSAIRDYEASMPGWAVPAIRESLGPVAVINALANPVLSAITGPALRLAARLRGGARP